MKYDVDPGHISSLLLRVASFIETPDGYGAGINGDTNIIPRGSEVDGKPSEFGVVNPQPAVESDPQVARFLDDGDAAPAEPVVPEAADRTTERVVNSPESAPDKEFMQTPWVKPPRRETFNESETRGYRNEYQENYRAEHGNT